MTLAWPDRAGVLAERFAGAPGRVRAYFERRAEQADERWLQRHADEIDAYLDRSARVDLRYRWSEACRRVGLGQQVVSPLGGTATGKIPRPVSCVVGPPDHLVIEMPSGVIVEDLEHYAPELSESLGVWRLRFVQITPPYVRVDLIDVDPLSMVVPYLPPAPVGHVTFGVDEFGATVSVPLSAFTHTICQGATRSGKSAFAYQLLAQLQAHPYVRIAGIDPTNLLFRPLGRDPWRAGGTENAADRYGSAMGLVVREMDKRIATMPMDRDTVEVGPDCPLITVILEEWAGVGRILGHKRDKPSPVHKHVARILAEGAKAGIRVVLLVQRAEADVVGAFEREQLLTGLTFGSATPDTLKMVHTVPVSEDMIAAQATAAPGCALMNGPGLGLTRIRAPWIGSYAAYVDFVTRRPPGDVAVAA